ncbi:hypothetical protein [Demequina sp. NBRC 110057]|uniref:hypothetical protein n=1 Tax=Demequina sp. NBRC 110057 TaxID=1570346 RepID=UPI000A05B26F|nr:hypothetical protein [Demequina sp. NBRC 110057]
MPYAPIAPPASAPVTAADAWLARRRPVALGVGTAAVIALVTWKAPVAGVVVAAAVAAVSWRLRGSRLSPWRSPEPLPVPIEVAAGPRWTFARNLVWRWDDAAVNAGLGSWRGDDYAYEGLALLGFTESDAGVIAHARLAPGQSAGDVAASEARLAAGLEAASSTVIGGTDDTVAILVEPVDAAGEWT